MKNTPRFPIRQGQTSRQAHCDLPPASFEREMGREGFFGAVSHIYHAHPPTAWQSFDGPLGPHCFDCNALHSNVTSPWLSARLLHNTQVELRYWTLSTSMSELARNADGDTLLFVHRGAGDLYCDFGRLSFCEGDYLLLPRGTLWRLEIASECQLLLVEAVAAALKLPERGLLGPTALFDPAVLDYPELDDAFARQRSEEPWSIQIKKQNQITRLQYPFNPLDALGWHGDNTVLKINWRDLRPLMSHRYHLPPSAHTTFVGEGFVVCTFCPRPVESDVGALKVPFFHSNDDFDEVLFYHRGNFFSRDNIEAGFITLHPSGFPHGPHPKALQKSLDNPAEFIDEVAVMIDAREPLAISAEARAVEDKNYVDSWKVKP